MQKTEAPLAPHSYPLWIKASGIFLVALALITIPVFFWTDFSKHRAIGTKIRHASEAFSNKDYQKAIPLYNELLTNLPSYNEAKFALAKSYFALSATDPAQYQAGLSLLRTTTIPKKEFQEITAYVPAAYKSEFIASFTVKS